MKRHSKLLSLLIAVAMIATIIPLGTIMASAAVEYPWSGTGTSADPYIIATVADLNSLSAYTSGTAVDGDGKAIEKNDFKDVYFKINADITYSSSDTFVPINAFSGTIDGDNHVISGIKYTATDPMNCGLFTVNNGTIKNIVLTDSTFTYSNGTLVISILGMGSIVGYNTGTISGCSSNATMIFTPSGDYFLSGIGGITGVNTSTGVVSGCNFTGVAVGHMYTTSAVGGIVGYNNGGSITNCIDAGITRCYRQTSGAIAGITKSYGSGEDLVSDSITGCSYHEYSAAYAYIDGDSDSAVVEGTKTASASFDKTVLPTALQSLTGKVYNPYTISKADDLSKLSSDIYGVYSLTADITLTDWYYNSDSTNLAAYKLANSSSIASAIAEKIESGGLSDGTTIDDITSFEGLAAVIDIDNAVTSASGLFEDGITPVNTFYGLIVGNDHTVNNLKTKSYSDDNNVYSSLIVFNKGIITNLKIGTTAADTTNTDLMLRTDGKTTITATASGTKTAFAAPIAAVNVGQILNCTALSATEISAVSAAVESAFAGALTANNEYGIIKDCTNSLTAGTVKATMSENAVVITALNDAYITDYRNSSVTYAVSPTSISHVIGENLKTSEVTVIPTYTDGTNTAEGTALSTSEYGFVTYATTEGTRDVTIKLLDNDGNPTGTTLGTVSVTFSDTLSLTNSSTYALDTTNGYVTGVTGNTSLQTFLTNFNGSSEIKVYKSDGTTEVTSGIVGTGMIAKLVVNGVVADSTTIVVAGDVSGDGLIRTGDVTKILNHIAGTTLQTGAYLKAADVNSNGAVNTGDATKALNIIAQS